MRNVLLVMTAVVALLPSAANADQFRLHKPDKAMAPDKPLPLKRSSNACAEYGAGFVKIEGTGTCMKIGGAISVGAGVSHGAR